MNREDQAEAYLDEARLTRESAEAIYEAAAEEHHQLWADVVKNGYDAIEQALSAGIARQGEAIPRNHPGKVNTFIELYDVDEDLEDTLLEWLRRRGSSQYVDIRGDEITVPHREFDRDDAEQILQDAERVIALTERLLADRS